MRIAVYTGTFNPMHIGHAAIIRHILGSGEFDKVYLIVTPWNPFKDESLENSADTRLNDVRSAVSRLGLGDRLVVDDIEYRMPRPNYTINTLDALKKREPWNEFTLLIGADNLHEILTWREGERILREYGVCVFPRSGFDMFGDLESIRSGFSPCEYCPYKISLVLSAPVIDISSTEIRQMISEGKDVSSYII